MERIELSLSPYQRDILPLEDISKLVLMNGFQPFQKKALNDISEFIRCGFQSFREKTLEDISKN